MADTGFHKIAFFSGANFIEEILSEALVIEALDKRPAEAGGQVHILGIEIGVGDGSFG